jgi:hypothetical protein
VLGREARSRRDAAVCFQMSSLVFCICLV